MNILSTRLYAAMQKPLISMQKTSSRTHPSAASIEVPSKEGGTQIIGACIREQWYRRKGFAPTETKNINWELAAIQGEYLHQMVVDLLNNNGITMGVQQMAVESSIYESLINLSGRIDYLAYDHLNDEVIGVEIKSVGDYKSKKCLEYPDSTHILQAMLYLDHYQKHVPEEQIRPKKWFILYVARGENWDLKGKKQLSPFVQLWDFYIQLEGEDKHAVVYTPQGKTIEESLTIKGIWDRYDLLNRHDKDNTIPERDFELQYSEERLAGLYKLGLIEFKKDKEPIAKWLSKGAPEGELNVIMGDAACKFCSYSQMCWGEEAGKGIITTGMTYNFPGSIKKEINNQTDIL